VHQLRANSFEGVEEVEEANAEHRDNIPSNEDPNEILPTFPYMVWNSDSLNTPAACIAQCKTFGYNAAGLEYGSECCKTLLFFHTCITS
jgi:hypothetical protein